MKRLSLAAGVVVLIALAGAPVVQAAPSTPFTGSWTSIDPVDGSIQHLDVRGGASVQVSYVDEYGTTCVEIGAPTTVFTGRLSGTADGATMTARFNQAACGSVLVLKAAYRFSWAFTYDPGTDTLFGALDDGPATWPRE
jgi:hypothetical protein